MLGEKIAEETSKTIGRRVLSVDGAPKVETSAQGLGKLLGIDYQSVVTYTANLRPDGVLAGEGVGLVMGKGGETATWTGKGVGKFTQNGGVSWRGAFFFQSAHPAWSRLNAIATVFEYEIDAEGNGRGAIYEWK